MEIQITESEQKKLVEGKDVVFAGSINKVNGYVRITFEEATDDFLKKSGD